MDSAEAGKEIRRAVDTGKVLFGVKETLYSIRNGEGLLLVLARNTPLLTTENVLHLAQLSEIPVYSFSGSGLELGSVCGKPFVVSTLLVMDAGKSKVMELSKPQTAAEPTKKTTRGRKKVATA
jgi:large subunit ribosomal protein L30e